MANNKMVGFIGAVAVIANRGDRKDKAAPNPPPKQPVPDAQQYDAPVSSARVERPCRAPVSSARPGPLRRYTGPADKAEAADIESLELWFMSSRGDTATSLYFERNGIRHFVQMTFHLATRPRVIPARLIPRDDPRTSMALASGREPGLSLGGPVSLWLCDARANQANSNAYLATPEVNQALPF